MIEAQGTIPFLQDFDEKFQSVRQISPAWLQSQRDQASREIFESGVPTTRDEEWKYTSLGGLNEPSLTCQNQPLSLPTSQCEDWWRSADTRVVFHNGVFLPQFSKLDKLPEGVLVASLANVLNGENKALITILSRFQNESCNFFERLNTALFQEGVLISVPPNTIVDSFIHIVHLSSAGVQPFFTAPRCLIHLAKSSQASIMESHLCFENSAVYLNCPVTEIVLDENASIQYINAQSESARATHINTTRAWCERNSVFNALTLTCGGKLVRNDLDIILNGEGIDATLNGLYSPYGTQHVDNHTSVDHRFPNCVSNQLYKGILNEQARAVFNGKIFVKPIAQQTNSYQLNKNLLLGRDCRVDTKPQLEIFADDVKCTHGATIGQLNEDELFYLQTRGISRAAAIKTLARGFADELINKFPDASIRQKLRALLEPSFERFRKSGLV